MTTRDDHDPPHTCQLCDGTGYVDGPTEHETIGGQPHPYTTVIPCRCRTYLRGAT